MCLGRAGAQVYSTITEWTLGVRQVSRTVRQLLPAYDGYECKEPEDGKLTLAFRWPPTPPTSPSTESTHEPACPRVVNAEFLSVPVSAEEFRVQGCSLPLAGDAVASVSPLNLSLLGGTYGGKILF